MREKHAARIERVRFAPGQTVTTRFPILHDAASEKATITLQILSFTVTGERNGADGVYRSEFEFAWTNGIAGPNPAHGSTNFLPGATLAASSFPAVQRTTMLPSPAVADLRTTHRQVGGSAIVTSIELEIEIDEVYFVPGEPIRRGGGPNFAGGGQLTAGETSQGLVRIGHGEARCD